MRILMYEISTIIHYKFNITLKTNFSDISIIEKSYPWSILYSYLRSPIDRVDALILPTIAFLFIFVTR